MNHRFSLLAVGAARPTALLIALCLTAILLAVFSLPRETASHNIIAPAPAKSATLAPPPAPSAPDVVVPAPALAPADAANSNASTQPPAQVIVAPPPVLPPPPGQLGPAYYAPRSGGR